MAQNRELGIVGRAGDVRRRRGVEMPEMQRTDGNRPIFRCSVIYTDKLVKMLFTDYEQSLRVQYLYHKYSKALKYSAQSRTVDE